MKGQLPNMPIYTKKGDKGGTKLLQDKRKRSKSSCRVRSLGEIDELNSLIGLQESHGITLVPIRLYAKKSVVKLEIGIARGRKKHDKREAIKKKDIARSRQRGNAGY